MINNKCDQLSSSTRFVYKLLYQTNCSEEQQALSELHFYYKGRTKQTVEVPSRQKILGRTQKLKSFILYLLVSKASKSNRLVVIRTIQNYLFLTFLTSPLSTFFYFQNTFYKKMSVGQLLASLMDKYGASLQNAALLAHLNQAEGGETTYVYLRIFKYAHLSLFLSNYHLSLSLSLSFYLSIYPAIYHIYIFLYKSTLSIYL